MRDLIDPFRATHTQTNEARSTLGGALAGFLSAADWGTVSLIWAPHRGLSPYGSGPDLRERMGDLTALCIKRGYYPILSPLRPLRWIEMAAAAPRGFLRRADRGTWT